ncbi:MAG: hypothetical protein MI892_23445 [Desulfobacterales bacterium]|nr:hypothetical protein [Desulfobacterales bacterium]
MKLFILYLSLAICLLTPLSASADENHGEGHICFMRIDQDGNGWMTFEEFSNVFGDDQDKFSQMDQDKDKRVSHDEYETWHYENG